VKERQGTQDINQVVPTSLAHLVGNSSIIEQVRIAIDAAFQDKTRFPHTALFSPAGLGKSTVARCIASEMCVPFVECLGQNIRTVSDLMSLLLKAPDKAIVFIDECHELPKPIQTQLYMALDQRALKIPVGTSIETIPINDATLILGSTDEWAILSPLISRMKLQLHLGWYTEIELERILAIRTNALKWEVDEWTLQSIAMRSRSTARRALSILESARRMCRADGETRITIHHLERACKADGLCHGGLERRDRFYLRLLMESPQRVNVLASAMGIAVKTLTTHIEPPLIRLGWLSKDDQGRRTLTAKARHHLKECGDE
jgi:Holliday junction DNA helicase RuvB